MTDHAAILAPQFVSGVAYSAERLDSDAPYRDHTAADKAAQAEALRRVLAEVDAQETGMAGSTTYASVVEAIKHTAIDLGVDL